MKRLALIAALSFAALPAMAQGTFTPYGGSIYGGPPDGYIYQPYQNNQYAPPVPTPRPEPVQRSVTCMTYGIQTVCQ